MGVNKVIITAAGYGTRFLPATKVVPKEMLPIVDKPILQYLVEEAVSSGIKEIIIVTRFGQSAVEDHFDSNLGLETQLEKTGKVEALREVQRVYRMADFVFLRQGRHLPYGNATPLICAAGLIGENEPFAYMFGDDLVTSEKPCLKQLMEVYDKEKPVAVLAVQETPWEEVERYATVRYRKGTKINQIVEVLEKLPRDQAPSNMAQFGRFIFTPRVIDQALRRLKERRFGKNGELWVADILNDLAADERVIAQPIEGRWLTTGDPLRFIKTQLEYALQREDIAADLRNFIKTLI